MRKETKNPVQEFRQRKITKAQLGTKIQNFWNWWKNNNKVGAIVENPAVMTAAGWRINNGQAVQDKQNDKDVRKLRDNISTIGETGITAPTLAADLGSVVSFIRHPIKGVRSLYNNGKQIVNEAKGLTNKNEGFLYDNPIRQGMQEGVLDVLNYYQSPEYVKHLESTGLTHAEALELQKFKLDNLDATKITEGPLNGQRAGTTLLMSDGKINVVVNPELSNTRNLANETVRHEFGGHATSRNWRNSDRENYISYPELKEIFEHPWYDKISKHSQEILPELKPQWKAFVDGDMKTFNKLATPEDLQALKEYPDIKAFVDYINDEQEAVARALAWNIGDYANKPTTWNMNQLKRFFTDEGVAKLRKNVWSLALPGVANMTYDYLPKKYYGGSIVERFKKGRKEEIEKLI